MKRKQTAVQDCRRCECKTELWYERATSSGNGENMHVMDSFQVVEGFLHLNQYILSKD